MDAREPHALSARLSLRKSGHEIDAIETRFGMRQFTRDGYHLLLNGKRLMLRGYGDDHIYPAEMAMPCDKQLHLARLRTIKSYGFNHVRHHSTMMPPEYYDACDEVGMIATAEFAICYEAFMPGIGATWKTKVKPGTDPSAALQTYQREWEAAIKRHRNHPSILCWVRGNELYGQLLMVDEFARIAKRCDPGRWFVDTDGFYIGDLKKDRKTIPLLFTQFAEWEDPIDNPNKHKTGRPVKPIISHEMANYVTFSRPDLVDQFRHNIKPFWLTAGKAKLERTGTGAGGRSMGRKIGTALCLVAQIQFGIPAQESRHFRLSLVVVPGLLDQFEWVGRSLFSSESDHQGRSVAIQQ